MTVAIVGYLTGHGRSAAAPAEGTGEASNAAMTLSYPSGTGWRPTSSVSEVPGLPLAKPLGLAPAGDGAAAGLIVGRLSGVASHPIPEQLLVRLRGLPRAEVVSLPDTQAYRYPRLQLTGYGHRLTLYTIPSSPTSTTAVICYTSPRLPSYMRACEQLVGSLTITTGRPQSAVRSYYSLTPAAGYARQIRTAVARVDGLLRSVRPEIHPGVERATASALANRLADGLAGAGASLSAVPPPPAIGGVHAALSRSLEQASAAYSALATAVGTGNATAYAAARTEIYVTEAALSAALRDFALLAYN